MEENVQKEKTGVEKIYLYLKDKKSASNLEIAEAVGMSEGVTRATISKLVKKGIISKDGQDYKILTALKPEKVKKAKVDPELSIKKELYERIIEIYLYHFEQATTVDDIMKLGKELRLTMSKM